MSLDAFRQEPFPAALTPPRKSSASALGPHSGTEAMLAFAGAFGCLIGAFHKAENKCRRDLRAVTLGMGRALSIGAARSAAIAGCHCFDFLG